jgi:ornithine cyclodeaminase/alanine dehydrogenase-like protein (mu-crystallin family)
MAPRPHFLFLSESDMIAAGVDDAARCVEVSEEVFRLLHRGDYVMGGPTGNSHGLGLVFPKTSPFPNMPVAGPDRRFVAMPAYLGGRFDLCGNKWYGSNAANPASGLPRSVLTLMLNDRETGEPLALMAANTLSAARTGAVPAVASRHLPPTPPVTLAVIGCGVINRAVVRALLSQHATITTVACFNRSPQKAEEFAAWVRDDYGLDARVVESAERCVADADLVTVAASRTAPLHVRSEWFAPEATIMLSGPMQADDELWTSSRVVYDHIALHEAYVEDARSAPDLHAAYDATIGGPFYRLIDSGELPPLVESEDLGAIIERGGEVPRGRRTVFIACGMAVFDLAWGADLLATAEREQLGQRLDLWSNQLA